MQNKTTSQLFIIKNENIFKTKQQINIWMFKENKEQSKKASCRKIDV